jgi:hypothetical protein
VTCNDPMTEVRMTLPIAILGPVVAALIATAVGFSYMLIGHRVAVLPPARDARRASPAASRW